MLRLVVVALAMVLAMAPAFAQTTDFKPEVGQAGKDVIWVPTPDTLVRAMLDRAKVGPSDYLVDLGAGDGKIAIAAARDYGARALGVEYNPDMVALAKRNAAAAGVAERASFIEADIFKTDFSDATVVTLYLLPSLNLRLRDTLLAMKPGTRIVSNSFDMGDWRADAEFDTPDGIGFYWVVPADARGRWRFIGAGSGVTELAFDQTFQTVNGAGVVDGVAVKIAGTLAGSTLSATLRPEQGQAWMLRGQIVGGGFSGSLKRGLRGAPILVQADRTAR